MNQPYYKLKEFASLLNVSVVTLQRWDREGKLVAYRTPTNRRYYTHQQFLDYTQHQTPSHPQMTSLNRCLEVTSLFDVGQQGRRCLTEGKTYQVLNLRFELGRCYFKIMDDQGNLNDYDSCQFENIELNLVHHYC